MTYIKSAGLATANTFTEDQTIEANNALLLADVGAVQSAGSGATGTVEAARNARYNGTAWVRTAADNDASLLEWGSQGDLIFYTNTDAGNTVGSTITWGEKFRIQKAGNIESVIGYIRSRRDNNTANDVVIGSNGTGAAPGIAFGAAADTAIVRAAAGILTGTVCDQIGESVLASDTGTITFGSIPATYRHLQLHCHAGSTSMGALLFRFNGITTAAYHSQRMSWTTSSTGTLTNTDTGTAIEMGSLGSAVSYHASHTILIPGYRNLVQGYGRPVFWQSWVNTDGAASGNRIEVGGGMYETPDAMTSITLLPAAGNFRSGSVFTLYGLR